MTACFAPATKPGMVLAAGRRLLGGLFCNRVKMMDERELRIPVTEEMVRELLWRALTPDAIVMLHDLNDALEQHDAPFRTSPEMYQITGISVTTENGVMYAEIKYAQVTEETTS